VKVKAVEAEKSPSGMAPNLCRVHYYV